MEYRNLGQSGLRVSATGLGCNNFGGRIDLEATRRVVHAALDLGITLFDTADVYGDRGGSETCLGQVLKADRKGIVLATKFGMAMDDGGVRSGASRRYIIAAAEASLRRLKTDWIDLYQVHRPDPLTPIEETLRALDDLVQAGKVRYIGCSNFAGWQVVDAYWTARTVGCERFISCQDEYSLATRNVEQELIPAASRCGMGVLPYFPLASGLLTGKYRQNTPYPPGSRLATTPRLADRYLTERNWRTAERLSDFAAAHGISPVEVAFGWLLSRPSVASVIAGATRPEQIAENVRAAAWKPTQDHLAEIDRFTAAPAE